MNIVDNDLVATKLVHSRISNIKCWNGLLLNCNKLSAFDSRIQKFADVIASNPRASHVYNEYEIGHKTEVKDEKGVVENVDIGRMSVIPNFGISKLFSFFAKDGEEKVEMLYSRSAYGHDKNWTNEIKSNQFKYPVVYSSTLNGPRIWYSNTNKNGHFGIPKLIVNMNQPISNFVDYNGEYGMSEFCVGVVGDKEYLDMVKIVMDNQRKNGFRDIMESMNFKQALFNHNIIKQFRKDFWKEFL